MVPQQQAGEIEASRSDEWGGKSARCLQVSAFN